MSNQETLRKLRAFNARITGNEESRLVEESVEANVPIEQSIDTESIILRSQRPVLAIQDGTTTLEFRDLADGTIWKAPLEKAKDILAPVIAAVGRVDLFANPDYRWVGTAWLIDENIAVTNRHVAEIFAQNRNNKFVFREGVNADQSAEVDFLHEIDRDTTRAFSVKRVLHIESRTGPDLAFLELDGQSGRLAAPIPLSSGRGGPNENVAVIGYPAFDSRIPEPELMERIYGKIYDRKRLAPGAITESDSKLVMHNCTTLGGNSGSVVVDLKTGEALGLHFSGSFLRTNLAVRADVVSERLHALKNGTISRRTEIVRPPRREASSVANNIPPRNLHTVADSNGARSFTIPLTVTLSFGDPSAPQISAPTKASRMSAQPVSDDDDEMTENEATTRVEDYAGRSGYVPEFLGDDFAVELPTVIRNKRDILTFNGDEQELKYEHFSVVMNERRRMCFFSACNIDGERNKGAKRGAWRFDPRIPRELQIMKECYGNAPRFSRGHMTRREDPAWGTAAERQRGSDDSMHVTNATPQMQTFNSPIWLALEDYALQHAREDDMKISVFTGPYFTRNDPEMFGVRIPVKFWKVIAFIHDETGELSATGYEMSQDGQLDEQEFVFGQFRSPQLNVMTQVSIASIESKSGISFGGLSDVDPFGQESVGPGSGGPLTRFEQIRFT